jgi:hypothetical protein
MIKCKRDESEKSEKEISDYSSGFAITGFFSWMFHL